MAYVPEAEDSGTYAGPTRGPPSAGRSAPVIRPVASDAGRSTARDVLGLTDAAQRQPRGDGVLGVLAHPGPPDALDEPQRCLHVDGERHRPRVPRAVTHTWAPTAASAPATALPIPRDPPVTTATLPWSPYGDFIRVPSHDAPSDD
ncbi:hypothetical protein BX257_1645 [Streptomyces sp. 3212.3]|nr:hypothetical protein BX257_1645 [Streptomyces sp. 3212.3]